MRPSSDAQNFKTGAATVAQVEARRVVLDLGGWVIFFDSTNIYVYIYT